MANYKLLAATLGVVAVVLLGAFAYEFSAYTGEVASANSLSTQVSQLQVQLSSATKDIANLTTRLNSAQGTIASLTSQVAALQAELHQDEAKISAMQAELKTLLAPPTVSQASANYCVLMSSCQTSLFQLIPAGNLIVASGGCPGPFVNFTDSLGNNFTVDASASVLKAGMPEAVATAHAVNQNGSALDTITMNCGSSGTIGLQVLTVTGLFEPFTVVTGTGSCTSNCSQLLSTATPVSFNGSRSFVAIGAVFAYPGCSCSSPGPGFTMLISHDNRLLASEYATAIRSPTSFPLTDGYYPGTYVPTEWLDVGVVYVSAL